MSITVVIARDDVGAPSTREVFETGVKYTSDGGDLSILSARPQLLATYGSGNWLSVYIDEVVSVISEKPADDDDADSFDFGSSDSDDSDDSDSDDSSTDDSSSDDSADADSSSATEDEPAVV